MKKHFEYRINNKSPEEKKPYIQTLFDSIVPTYDLLNHVLSFGTDIFWRRKIFRLIETVKEKSAIDLCCGTGDLSLLLHKKGASVVSLDFSMSMLKRGIEKGALKNFPIAADASIIPFADNSFHVATIAFGIRNIPDLDNFIKEVQRILKPDGKLVILELVRPPNKIIGGVYSFYMGSILPVLGGIISGKITAYRYLSKTIATFVDPVTLQTLLEKYGFINISHYPQTFGVSTIMIGTKK